MFNQAHVNSDIVYLDPQMEHCTIKQNKRTRNIGHIEEIDINNLYKQFMSSEEIDGIMQSTKHIIIHKNYQYVSNISSDLSKKNKRIRNSKRISYIVQ